MDSFPCSSFICGGSTQSSELFTYGYFNICISNNFNVYSLGYSPNSAHGHDTKNILSPTYINGLNNIKMIDCGSSHTIFLDFGGNIYTVGSNYNGQLGIGKKRDELEYTHILQKINLPSIKQVCCGKNFTLCLSEDGALYIFGYNNYSPLDIVIPDCISPILYTDIKDIEYITCGASHIICKTQDNKYYSWGNNYYGQLGINNNESSTNPIQCTNWPTNIINIKCGYFHTLLLTEEKQVYSFGRNYSGQLGINYNYIKSINTPRLIQDIPEIQRIECGYYHSMCIDINNNLWLFGNNEFGELGLGDTENRYKPILHPTLSNIIDISSGGVNTFVKTYNCKIYGFGSNFFSQLGVKTSNEIQSIPIEVFIDKEDIWCSTIGKSRAKSARK